jgi:AcrR family transcriptional regulator
MNDSRVPAGGQAGLEAGQAGFEAGQPAGRRGRPRSQEADQAIMAAAIELLAERGLAGTSIEEVAARAGVAKTTIYRRWPSRGALALDAFLAEFQGQQPSPDTGTLRGDLLGALRAWIRSVTRTSAGPVVAGLIAEAQQDPELAAAWRERVVERLRDQHKVLLNRAVERGELAASTDQDVVLDLLFGAAYHRLLHGHRPLSDKFARQVVDMIIDGIERA